MSRGDEIDELVSSVRNFVAHKDSHRMATPVASEKLVLTADTRLSDEQVKAIDAEWEAELRALEAAGIIEPGKALELSIEELEEAVAKLPDDWDADHNPLALDLSSVAQGPEEANSEEPETDQSAPLFDKSELEDLIVSKMGELIDQEALRALVVKTVHEELGGELGERITRNVRKLVRREINRVMTSRDLSGD